MLRVTLQWLPSKLHPTQGDGEWCSRRGDIIQDRVEATPGGHEKADKTGACRVGAISVPNTNHHSDVSPITQAAMDPRW